MDVRCLYQNENDCSAIFPDVKNYILGKSLNKKAGNLRRSLSWGALSSTELESIYDASESSYAYSAKPGRRLPRRVVLTLTALFTLSACFGPPRSLSEDKDEAHFYALCNNPERVFIRRTVQAAGIVVGAGQGPMQIKCSDPRFVTANLLDDGYDHYECLNLPWMKRRVEEFKTYRFSLEDTGAEACNHPWSSEMTSPQLRRRANLPDGKCLAVQEYAQPKGRYLLLSDAGRVRPDGTYEAGDNASWTLEPGVILFGKANVIDLTTGGVLAEKTTYYYLPYGSRYQGTWTSEAGWGKQECPQEERARRSRPKKRWPWEVVDVVKPQTKE